MTRAGPPLAVKSVTWERKRAGFTVYNFEVEPLSAKEGDGATTHSYFVGREGSGAWVHNAEYLAPKAPKQVTPGTARLTGQYVNDLGHVEPWVAHYDEFGRLIGRTDYTRGNMAHGIPPTHYHTYGDWGPANTMGRETGSHLPGTFAPPVRFFPAK